MSLSATTIITTTRAVIKYSGMAYEYIKDDQGARLGLLEPVRITVEGPGVGIGDFRSPDGLLVMVSPTINKLELEIRVFPADQRSYWNGPDGLPNTWKGGAGPSSLFHDFTCRWRKAIAAALGCTEDEVWVWSAGILATTWRHYGGYTPRANGESWIAYHLIRPARRPYEWAKKRLGFACVVFAAVAVTGCTGCPTPMPDWRVTAADPVIWVEGGRVTTNTPPISVQRTGEPVIIQE